MKRTCQHLIEAKAANIEEVSVVGGGTTVCILPLLHSQRNALYTSRKNAVEGRNSQLTRLGLKRVWSYDLPGATADITFADLLVNLRTLGRLVQEATLLVA